MSDSRPVDVRFHIILPDIGPEHLGAFKLNEKHFESAWIEAQKCAESREYDGVANVKFIAICRGKIGGEWTTTLQFSAQMFGGGIAVSSGV